MRRRQGEVVTFKADDALLEAMRGIPNRSEFIRTAVLRALENICPVCKGSGILTPNQKRHWTAFARHHKFQECDTCHEYRLVCVSKRGGRQGQDDAYVLELSKVPDGAAPARVAGDPPDRRTQPLSEGLPAAAKRRRAGGAGK